MSKFKGEVFKSILKIHIVNLMIQNMNLNVNY